MNTFFRKARILRAFAIPYYLLLWSGQSLSRIGDFLYEVALVWWVVEKTGSATALATVLALAEIPSIVFLLVGGVIGDRVPRALIIFLADLVRGATVTIVTIQAVTGRLEIWQIYIASLFFGVSMAFFQPAYTALVPELVSEEDLTSANSMDSLSIQFGRVAGPALAAIIVSQLGAGAAFGMNAASFFIAGIMMLPILRNTLPVAKTPEALKLPGDQGVSGPLNEDALTNRSVREYEPAGVGLNSMAEGNQPSGKPIEQVETKNFWGELGEGFRFVTRTPWLWVSILLFALTNVTLSGPFSVAMPVLVKENLGQDVRLLALIYGIFPIGYAISSLALGVREHLPHRGWIIYGGSIVAGLMLAIFGIPLPLFVLGAAALVNGAALEASNLAWINSLQSLVPREKLGRVASVDGLGSYVLMPVGFAVAGWATDRFGAQAVFLVGGCITAVVAIMIFILQPAVRRLENGISPQT